MWNIYVIFALGVPLVNAQSNLYNTKSRGGNEVQRNTLISSGLYPINDFNINVTNSSNNNNKHDTTLGLIYSSRHVYNTSFRNSFGNANKFAENNVPPRENGFHYSFETNLGTPCASPAWEVPATTLFNAKLFEIMSSSALQQNLVFSPISLQTLLAFIFTLSSGPLHNELAQLLAVIPNRTYVGETFERVVQTASQYTSPTTLIMANKLYYDSRYGPIDDGVRNFAKNSFASELEGLDFLASKKAASTINSWVSERTHNLIHDIVTPSSIAADTSALLLNSIYFKSEWLTKFATYDTESQQFFVTKDIRVPVEMMHNEDVFRYGDFPDLQASVVELPYTTSNLTMMLLLPTSVEGLTELEKKLKCYDFESISRRLKRETVTVKLPRFKVEYEADMIRTLQQMGVHALFNNVGHINLFKNQQKPLKVDQFKHKSFIKVNEAGTEATAATVAKYVPLSIPINMKYFTADHPFMFIIRDSSITFFIGHVREF